jgi:hypothetical protein
MDDAEHKNHLVFADDVVHHPVIADAESVERVRESSDGLDCLTADQTGSRSILSKLLEWVGDPRSNLW